MAEIKEAFESEEAILDYIKLEEKKEEARDARKYANADPYSQGKYNKFFDARSGKTVKDIDGSHFASRSP